MEGVGGEFEGEIAALSFVIGLEVVGVVDGVLRVVYYCFSRKPDLFAFNVASHRTLWLTVVSSKYSLAQLAATPVSHGLHVAPRASITICQDSCTF